MASFASTPVEFTPYIAPSNLELEAQNIELEGRVGMQLQQQYNQNAQKIQGVVDTIAGLQVVKPEHKEYLSKAMGTLMSDLKTIAGSDLSQQSVLTQAASFASKVYNDKNIQNAVLSTKHYQDAITQVQDMRKAGKSAASNDNMVMREANKWLNDGQLDSTLTKQSYTPYYNYQKDWLDFLKAKQVSVDVYQAPAGEFTPVDPVSGKPNHMMAYAMVDGKKEVLTPQEVSNLFQQFLGTNAQAQTQVDIDATYFSDLTPTEAALSQVQTMREQMVGQMTAELGDLEVQQASLANTDESLNRKIEQYRQGISSVVDGAQEQDALFLSNPEAAKKSLFTSNLVNSMGSSFAYQKMERKYTSNPMRSAFMEEQKFHADQEYRKASLDLRREQNAIAKQKKRSGSGEGGEQRGLLTAGGVNTDTEDQTTPAEANMQIDGLISEVTQDKLKVIFEIMGGVNREGGLVRLGRTSGGQPIYTWEGQSDFNDVWEKVTTGEKAINKNLGDKKPSIQSYFRDPTDVTRGIGKEMYTKALVDKRNKIQEQVKQEYSTIPAFAERWNQRIPLSDGSSITFGELASRVNASDAQIGDWFDAATLYDSESFKDIRARTAEVDVLAYTDATTQGLAEYTLNTLPLLRKRASRVVTEQALNETNPELFQALAVIADNKAAIRQKGSYVQNLYNQNLNNVSQNKSISMSFQGESGKYAKDLAAAMMTVVPSDKTGSELVKMREDLAKAVSESGATVSATKIGLTDEYRLTVFSKSYPDGVSMKVDPLTMSSLLPEMTEQKSGIRRMLEVKAEAPGTYSEIEYIPLVTNNTDKFRFQYKVSGSESSGYTGTVRYKYLDGPWKEKTGPIFGTPEEAQGGAIKFTQQPEDVLFATFGIQQ